MKSRKEYGFFLFLKKMGHIPPFATYEEFLDSPYSDEGVEQ